MGAKLSRIDQSFLSLFLCNTVLAKRATHFHEFWIKYENAFDLLTVINFYKTFKVRCINLFTVSALLVVIYYSLAILKGSNLIA